MVWFLVYRASVLVQWSAVVGAFDQTSTMFKAYSSEQTPVTGVELIARMAVNSVIECASNCLNCEDARCEGFLYQQRSCYGDSDSPTKSAGCQLLEIPNVNLLSFEPANSSCPEKFYLSKTASVSDINECDTNYGGCSTEADCINTPGSFYCQCKTGYVDQSANGTTGIICTGVTLSTKTGGLSFINTKQQNAFYHTAGGTYGSPFLLVPCLALQASTPNTYAQLHNSSCFSIKWENYTGYYLHNSSSVVYAELAPSPLTDEFALSASFIMHSDTFYAGHFALESADYPGFYIKALFTGFANIVSFDGTTDFMNRASFTKAPRSI